MVYEPVIGLEVHLQLKTKTKVFCGCSTEFGAQPNSQVCPICLGFPGVLPVLNKEAFFYAIKVALALNCKIQNFTKFDRKNYFYPDLPKNYQISQYDLPLAVEGVIYLELKDKTKPIRIKRIHLEEDAGKLIHQEDKSLVDYNRAGIPLLEIVSYPDINSPEEAYAYLINLKNTVEYLDVSDCDMEKGSLRCDANISLRQKGQEKLGVKVELKNMNSFKAVKDALTYEIERQKEILNNGGEIIQETRLWDEEKQKTLPMRTKEEAQDYRYFPDPDLLPFVITNEMVEKIKETIPELPQEKKRRFMKEYNLSEYEAKILVSSKRDADFIEYCLKLYPSKEKKLLVNWIIGPLLSEANARKCSIHELGLSANNFLELVEMVEKNLISALTAKSILTEMIDTKKNPKEIVEEKGLIQISDEEKLKEFIEETIKENPKSIEDYKQGKSNALMFLVGCVMKKTKGKANPKIVQDLLKRRLQNAKI